MSQDSDSPTAASVVPEWAASAVLTAFLSGLGESPSVSGEEAFLLGASLSALWRKGCDHWPDLAIEPATFGAFIAERVQPRSGALADEIGRLQGADLYLACACANGDPGAIAAFEAAYFQEVDRAACRDPQIASSLDDVKQILREKLFTGTQDHPSKIAEFEGRGELRNWFRVVAVRTLTNITTRGPKDVLLSGQDLEEALGLTSDPELVYLKELYRSEFRSAFASAAARLSGRDRQLLRYALVDKLHVKDLAAIYFVHESTVARWLATARQSLLDQVRSAIMNKLALSRDEFESILRLVRSRLELSLDRLLAA